MPVHIVRVFHKSQLSVAIGVVDHKRLNASQIMLILAKTYAASNKGEQLAPVVQLSNALDFPKAISLRTVNHEARLAIFCIHRNGALGSPIAL